MSCEEPSSELPCGFGCLSVQIFRIVFIIESLLDGSLMSDASNVFPSERIAWVSELYMLLAKLNFNVHLALFNGCIFGVLDKLPDPAFAWVRLSL